MSMGYGNNISRQVRNGIAKVSPTWTRLLATGTTPMPGRQWIEIQARGTTAIAIGYSNKGSDGLFAEPSYNAHSAKIIPTNAFKGEPLGDSVMMWGRAVNKVTSAAGGCKVIVTEYS